MGPPAKLLTLLVMMVLVRGDPPPASPLTSQVAPETVQPIQNNEFSHQNGWVGAPSAASLMPNMRAWTATPTWAQNMPMNAQAMSQLYPTFVILRICPIVSFSHWAPNH